MVVLPRLALVTASTGTDPSPACLALMAGLTVEGWRVQHFVSRARPVSQGAVGWATGLPGRHLDDWLMPAPICREVFARGARRMDLAVVEGTLDRTEPASDRSPYDHPGHLGSLANALNLPLVAVVDCRGGADFHLPRLPAEIDAVLLDGLPDRDAFEPIRQMVSWFLKRPVIGAVEELSEARAEIQDARPDSPPPKAALDRLAASFLRFVDKATLSALARSRPFPEAPGRLPLADRGRGFRIAYAQDEAFGGYYPDTLELLETLGAELVEFSPLCSETLPEAVDLVMIGCGYADQYADALAKNHCLITTLRNHVCRGLRIYSEGGGTAYLGQSLILDGRRIPGAGILPFEAELRSNPIGPTPVERTLCVESWLGPPGTVVRGYRSGRWRLRPTPEPCDCPSRFGPLTGSGDMYYRKHAVGGLIHLQLAALPQVVAAFTNQLSPAMAPPPLRR
ncbi:MAG: cobyrinic acid a,c-diamide synthase [Isosphaeraceae bacterium]